MATGDQYQNGVRHSATGELYIKSDATTTNTVTLSTPGMAAVGITAQIQPYGYARVSVEPTTLFSDVFDGSTIDVSRWTAAGTSAPTQGSGAATLSLAASNSISSTLISKPIFASSIGFLLLGATIGLESAQQTNPNCHRFFGFGQVTSYAATTPVTDGFGFEVDITGAFNCVVYIAGTRYVINSTNTALITAQASLPAGAASSTFGTTMTWPGLQHRVVVIIRGDLIYFYLDNIDVPVGVASFVQPAISTLPVRAAAITTAAVSTVLSTTFTVGAMGVADTSAQNSTLSPSSAQWAAPNNSTSAAYVASQVVKASPGNVYGLSGYNSKASAQFIQLFDSATVPADTAVPVTVITVPATSNFSIDFGVYGRKFTTGIAISNSSTGPTKTIGSADCWFDVRYV